ncbi:MAG: aminotransferase class III-fold pyridoxal phosphate-dependent enzyme [Candidatus Electrothrix sp. AUS1_2]|nr:aminotransferase class III-fold pyridoxal phosphate-dependent enzyme [Candidatus Electrothrix sp. AUS1_2]
MNRYNNSSVLLARALKTIPLASQTFSKSITQFPEGISPLFIERGQGSRVWDVDGNEYIDFISALGAVTLGYNDYDVTNAVQAQLKKGVTFSLPHPLEMEVAEALVDMIPCAEKVRFGKNGTDVTSAAIRIARACTGREHVAVCGYHGWQDWYIGSTTRNLGVPESTIALTHSFRYNDIQSLEEIFHLHKDQVAAVIMEPMNVSPPKPDFLQSVATVTRKNGAVFILDEMITGCRLGKGGAQECFSVVPDLATFGKGLANGFPLSALVGKNEMMSRMKDIFFSGTFGGETLSLAAAKTVLKKIADGEVVGKLLSQGKKVMDGVQSLIMKHNVDHLFTITGHPSFSFLLPKGSGESSSFAVKTLWMQEIFKRGILCIGSHNMTCSHSDADIERLLEVYDEVFPVIYNAVADNSLLDKLEVKPLEPLFQVR